VAFFTAIGYGSLRKRCRNATLRRLDSNGRPNLATLDLMRRRVITDGEYARGLRLLANDPDNQTGADKTWVLHFLRRLERLFKNARLKPKRRHGPVR
jgi:hypothetical protein